MTDNLFILGEDGLPESAIDTDAFQMRARRVSSLLALASRDPEEVAALISKEIMATDESAEVRLLFAATVLDSLVPGVVGPLLTFAEDRDPDVASALQPGGGE